MIIRPTYPLVHRPTFAIDVGAGGLPWSTREAASAQQSLRALLGAENTLWLDERGQTDSGGGKLTAWQDNSPLANSITQSTDGNRPATGQTIAGWAAPDFDGVDDFMVGPAISSIISQTLGWHAFVVLRPDTHLAIDGPGYDAGLVWGETGGYVWHSLHVSGSEAGQFDASTKQTAYQAITDSAVSIIEASWDATTISHRINAGATVTIASGTPDVVSNLFRIGSRGGTGKFDGRIAFLAICNRQLSAVRAAGIRAILAAKYGVSV